MAPVAGALLPKLFDVVQSKLEESAQPSTKTAAATISLAAPPDQACFKFQANKDSYFLFAVRSIQYGADRAALSYVVYGFKYGRTLGQSETGVRGLKLTFKTESATGEETTTSVTLGNAEVGAALRLATAEAKAPGTLPETGYVLDPFVRVIQETSGQVKYKRVPVSLMVSLTETKDANEAAGIAAETVKGSKSLAEAVLEAVLEALKLDANSKKPSSDDDDRKDAGQNPDVLNRNQF